MADAPSTGGKGWSAIEVIIVLILVIALLSKLRGVDPSIVPKDSTTTKSTVSQKNTKPKECGIAVLRPKPLETVGNFVTLTGTVSGCGWSPAGNVALYAQVVDAYGIPMSPYTTVYVSAENRDKVSTFSTNIAIAGEPAPGTGYVILFPAEMNTLSQQQTTSRIPIKFNR